MSHVRLLDHTSALLDRDGPGQGALAHAPSGLHFLRFAAPTVQDATVYRPLLCLVLQGAKEVGTSRRTLRVADGQSLVVSHAVPVVSRITEAAPDRPYVALVFPIDLDLLRGMAAGVAPARAANQHDAFSISLCQTDLEMEGALLRYLRHCEHAEGRKLKTAASRRMIPLAGVSLEAFRANPGGFPRYRDKAGMTATINNYLRENGLMETERHSLYGLRHAFEDRLLDRDVDERLRRDLMGHSLRRERYGQGASPRKLLEAIRRIAIDAPGASPRPIGRPDAG